jgi:NhaA family Na+:H+ antiporter
MHGVLVAAAKSSILSFVREYSLPLIAGVLAALVFANVAYERYDAMIHWGPLDGACADAEQDGFFCMSSHGGHTEGEDTHGETEHGDDAVAADAHAAAADTHGAEAEEPDHGTISAPRVFGIFGHHLTFHFIINDIFMLFFFGIAAKEITQSLLPGGALNPPGKALNPIAATLGGVIGPILLFLLMAVILVRTGILVTDDPQTAFSALPSAFTPGASFDDLHAAAVYRGWGVPTATDIALAWLAARIVFGSVHPAVNFLLLLAIADDGIGLIIIAIFYPSAEHPVQPIFLLLVVAGMAVAYGLRRAKVKSWIPYIALGGALSWTGLMNAALHPALALVPIVPFLPSSTFSASGEEQEGPLQHFEHSMKAFVDFGLFFFGMANAGVQFAVITPVTWLVSGSLIVGKLMGVTAFAAAANAIGFKYPPGMSLRHIVVAGSIAGMGLTVALFVAGEAYPGTSMHQGPAKMGALFSAGALIVAVVLGRILNVKKLDGE